MNGLAKEAGPPGVLSPKSSAGLSPTGRAAVTSWISVAEITEKLSTANSGEPLGTSVTSSVPVYPGPAPLNPVPVRVTVVPPATGPEVGLKEVMAGTGA